MTATGVQTAGGALNVTLNDTTQKGAYMPDGSLRVTDTAGAGLYDASGALRIATTVGRGVYQAFADAVRFSDAIDDGATGVQFKDGAIRMNEVFVGGGYITENAANFYVTEDGANFYVTE